MNYIYLPKFDVLWTNIILNTCIFIYIICGDLSDVIGHIRPLCIWSIKHENYIAGKHVNESQFDLNINKN